MELRTRFKYFSRGDLAIFTRVEKQSFVFAKNVVIPHDPDTLGCRFINTCEVFSLQREFLMRQEKSPRHHARRAINKNESTRGLHITKPASKKHFRFRASWPRVPALREPIAKQRVTCVHERHNYGASAAPWHREALAHRRLRQRRIVRRQGGSVPVARLVRRACPNRTGVRVSLGNVDRACQVAG